MMAKDIINQYEESLGEIAKISVVLVVAVIFIFFISADALKALKRRAHWIPSDYLVLTALTIQQLNLLNGHGALLEEALKNPMPFQANILKSDFWMIHSSQVMLCVVIAYLVPGMACRGFEDSWGKLSALVITIVVHVTSEVYTVHQAHSKLTGYLYLWPRTSGTSHVVYIVLACIVSMSFLMLVLLLACATIAGKGIEGIIVQKIPQILSTPHIEEDFSWRTVEDDVLRSWIVARAYNPEYIIARSALSSSAAAIVTVQIVASIARWYMEGPSVELYDLFAVLKFTGTVLQQVFVCIGWAIIGWRWATAVGYYRRWHSDTWHSGFQMEDFWTRHIRELQEAQEPHLPEEKMLEKKVKKLITKEPKNMGIPRKLLYVVLGLQWLMVLFSKACWIGSLMIFHNKCMSKLLSFILSKHQKAAFEDYSKYRKILEGIQMLRETPASMWIANRKSIVQAKKIITQGNEDAEYNCQELIEFLAGKRTPIASSCIHISKPQTRLKHLGKKEDEQSQVMEKQLLDVEQHFADLSNIQSWKMTAVSLIRIIIQLSPIFVEDSDDACSTSHVFPPKAVQNCLKAYSQAWQIIDFVEETEAGGDQIISQAADKYFRRLRTKVENGSLPANKFRHATPKCVAAALNELAEECKKQTEPSSGVNIVSALLSLLGSKNGKEEVKTDIWERVGGNDSIDWKAAATGNAVYKLCKSIDCSSTCDVKELLKELECSLADTIYACILKVKPMLVLNSRKWARDSRENKIGRALYTAGKAKVLLEEMKRAEQREQVFRRDPNPLAIVID